MSSSELIQPLKKLYGAIDAGAALRLRLSEISVQLQAKLCVGLVDKIEEYTHSGAKAENLLAELRMGLAVSTVSACPIEFQSRDEADIRVVGVDFNCTIEVQHKSSNHPVAAVFYPTPDDLKAYIQKRDPWQMAALKLHEVLATSPFEVHASLEEGLFEPSWDYTSRVKQEEECSTLATWLADKIGEVPAGSRTSLEHRLAFFALEPLDSPPGLICGFEAKRVHRIREFPVADDQRLTLSAWLEGAVLKKAQTADKHRERRGSQHLVALVIDEASASNGYVMANTFYGGLRVDSSLGRRHRAVPSACRPLMELAEGNGHSELLDRIHFDRSFKLMGREGLLREAVVRDHVDGVLALYYTDFLQFLPNPFTPRDIQGLQRRLPADFFQR